MLTLVREYGVGTVFRPRHPQGVEEARHVRQRVLSHVR